MARVRTGSIEWRNGVPYARVTFKDATGKRKQIKRAARNKSEAKQKVIELLRMIDDGLERVLASHQMTFADLVILFVPCHYARSLSLPTREG